MQVLTIEIEKDEDFFTAQCKEHSNCFTQGKTIEEAIHNIKEAIELPLFFMRMACKSTTLLRA